MSEEESENTGEIQRINGKFAPGVSGNPAGKPLGARSFTTKVKEALEKIADGKEYTYEEAFIKAILKKGIVDQDTGMMRTIWEQLDGKPLQRIEQEIKELSLNIHITGESKKLLEEYEKRLKKTILE